MDIYCDLLCIKNKLNYASRRRPFPWMNDCFISENIDII